MPVSTSDVVDYLTKRAEIDGLTWNVHDNSIAKYNSNSIYVEKKHVISTPVAPLSHVKEHVFLVRVNDVDINRVLDCLRDWPSITWSPIHETFESGSTSLTIQAGEITTTDAHAGIYSVRLKAVPAQDGYCRYLPGENITPKFVSVAFKIDQGSTNLTSNCPLFVGNVGGNTKWWGVIIRQGSNSTDFYDGSDYTKMTDSPSKNTWHVTLVKNIDWTNQTCDVYLDGTQVGNGMDFSPSGLTSCTQVQVKQVDFDNYTWYDNFIVSNFSHMDEPTDFLKSPQISSEYKGANQWDITFKVIEIG